MPRPGDIIEKKYKVVKRIGKGSYGSVYLVETISPPLEQYALKILEDVKMNEELKVGLGLGAKCPYLVGFKEVIIQEDDVIIVMEYCNGGDLSERIKQKGPATDAEIFRFFYESSMAVKKLHDAGIMHRDIKPGNFFLVIGGGYMLGDYGLARSMESLFAKTMTMVGTNGYTATEILKGKSYSNKIDIFALGVTLAEFILGFNPFSNQGQQIDLQRALDARPVDAALSNTHVLMKVALKMMAVEPDSRPTIDEVLATPLPASAVLPLLSGPGAGQRQGQGQGQGKGGGEEEKAKEKVMEQEKVIEGLRKQLGEAVSERDALRRENQRAQQVQQSSQHPPPPRQQTQQQPVQNSPPPPQQARQPPRPKTATRGRPKFSASGVFLGYE